MKLVLLSILFASLAVHGLAAEGTLEFVSIVFRHGARSPVGTYPKDIYKEADWPQGYGQLNIEGMREEYNLGALLRKQYLDTGFMNRSYNRSQIYVRSTDLDRTLMSAECVLAAMYPPSESEEFLPGLRWQPIPVHTVMGNDYLLRAYSANCSRYKLLMADTAKSTGYQATWNDNQALFDELTNYTGMPINLTNTWQLQDVLFQESYANLTTPNWYTPELKNKLQELADYTLGLMYNSLEKKQVTGGAWVNTVLNDMEDKVSPKSNLTDKMILYSAHDTTVAAMLSVFGLFDGKQPLFSSAFVIELYSSNSGHYVKFSYRNETDSSLFHALTHPNCTTNCPLNKLQQIMKPYRLTTEQVKELCIIGTPTPSPPPSSGSYNIVIGLAIALSLVTVVLILVLLGFVLVHACGRKNNNYRPINDSL